MPRSSTNCSASAGVSSSDNACNSGAAAVLMFKGVRCRQGAHIGRQFIPDRGIEAFHQTQLADALKQLIGGAVWHLDGQINIILGTITELYVIARFGIGVDPIKHGPAN